MDGLGTGALRGRDDGVDVEVAPACGRGPDADRDVRLGDVAGTGALRVAASPKASTRRVSAGSMMPSSHRRAVA